MTSIGGCARGLADQKEESASMRNAVIKEKAEPDRGRKKVKEIEKPSKQPARGRSGAWLKP